MTSAHGERTPTALRSRCQSIGERIEGYDDEGEAGDPSQDRSGKRA